MTVSQAGNLKQILDLNAAAAEQAAEDAEVLQASIKAGTVAQIVIAVIATIGLLYLLKLVLLTTLVAVLVAYLLDPPVCWMTSLRIPRRVGALLVVTLALAVAGGLTYFSYQRAMDFVDQLPQDSVRLREMWGRLRSETEKLGAGASSVVVAQTKGKEPVTVQVQQPQGLAQTISSNRQAIAEMLLAIGSVPFLVYFMLVSKQPTHVATVRLFPKEHRMLAHRTVGRISAMIRGFIITNVLLGLLNTVVLAAAFWMLGIKYFYFVGAISGFLTLIPYLGVFLALLAPLAAGLGTLGRTGIVVVLLTVTGLHLIMMNLVYPLIMGQRLRLNPLAVSLSLLFWAWIWGAPGLILAIPLLGAAKIICDHVEPLRGFGSWLGASLESKLP